MPSTVIACQTTCYTAYQSNMRMPFFAANGRLDIESQLVPKSPKFDTPLVGFCEIVRIREC